MMQPLNTIDAVNKQQNSLIHAFWDRFFVIIVLAYLAGISTAHLWIGGSAGTYWLVGTALFLLVLGICFKLVDLYKAVLILVVAVAGGVAFFYSVQQPAGGLINYADFPVYVEGTVIDEPLFYDDHTAYRLKVEVVETREGRFAIPGILLVRLYGSEDEHYWFGERLRLRGVIVEARGQRNPGGFDYNYYLRSQGIDALIYPKPAQVSSLGPGEVNGLAASAVKLRSSMVGVISKTLPSPAAELLTAILFGQRNGLPEDIENNFRRAGVGHLMAVSGLHVGLVAAFILGLWRRFKLRGRLPLILAIVLVFTYAYLTGMRPSALRAAVMVSTAMAALLFDREPDLPSAVAFAALVTLIINPLLLFTVGFQLSYAATLALIYGYRPLGKVLAFLHCPGILRPPLAITLAAQIGVPADVLEATIAEWNDAAAAGKDAVFGRTAGLVALDKPPYYAFETFPTMFDNSGGLKINAKAEVVDVWGKVIPGLYAAGQVAGGVIGEDYPGSGTALNAGATFGRIAGMNAAGKEA